MTFQRPFELVDIGDELEDFRGDRDVLDLVHGHYIRFRPFLAVLYPKAKISIFTRLYPFII